jgi:hypothetical protein
MCKKTGRKLREEATLFGQENLPGKKSRLRKYKKRGKENQGRTLSL